MPPCVSITNARTIRSVFFLQNVGEMVCHLPHEYPAVPPETFVRAHHLTKAQHKHLTEDLTSFVLEQDRNEIIIAALVQWVQDNLESYGNLKVTSDSQDKKASTSHTKDSKFSRMWIYSHHIYSKIKRKDILELTAELNLTGFTLPGKPGIIVVEGYSTAVEEFWGTIRRWQWKKLTMKEKEDQDITDKSINELRKFSNYEEKNFDAKAGKGRAIHMDLGMLYKYLEEKGCGHIFSLYFGVDGKGDD